MARYTNAAVCMLFAFLRATSAAQSQELQPNRPVTKVVTLLKDMVKQLQTEATEDQEVYEAMGCWCTTNEKEKTKTIADGTTKIGVLNSDIEKYAGGSSELNANIASLQKEIQKNQEALDSATALREKQLAEFTDEEKDMMSSIASLSSAVTTLSKHNKGALLQMTDVQEVDVMTTIQRALQKHKDLLSEVITPSQRRAVQAFLEQPNGYFDGAPVASLAAVASPHAEYAPQSGQIFGVLKQMKETFETNLAKSQEEEGLNQQGYSDLKEAKESEIKAGTDEFNKKSTLLAETDEKHAQAVEDLDQTTTTLAADKDFLANLKEHCVLADQEYEERTKTRQQEISAVSKALEFLTSDEAHDLFSKTLGGAASFVQRKESSKRRDALAQHLSAVAATTHDPRLITLVSRVRIDAFTKVKESLQGMIDNLVKEKEDEIKKKDLCIDSFNQNEKMTDIKKREKADAIAKLNDHTNAMEMLAKAIAKDKEEIAELRTQLKKVTENRVAANKDFQETVADQRATQKLLSATLGVLNSFYAKPSLMQARAAQAAAQPAGPPPPPGFKSYAKSASSGGVLNMIQSIINDAKAMEAEAIQAEEAEQQTYEDTVKNTNAVVKAKQEDIAQKTDIRAKEEQGKVSEEYTRDERIADIEQLMKEDLDLHYSCDYTLKNFELRLTARDEEIEALKQGLATFSGATFSAMIQSE